MVCAPTGAPRRRLLYRDGRSTGNRQESTAFFGMSERLYLDHAATTPVLPEAGAAMARALAAWANPSSPHADGRRARSALEEARRAVAKALGWRHDVIFTSGASEA